jgi:hypothetical protein|tara:strand:- start:30 stop:143 length:114 start_codon:yes stop_codon:yes gene_type:complete
MNPDSFIRVSATICKEFWQQVRNGDASINDIEWEEEE